MPTVKCSFLILLQFISYSFYAQNSSKIILGNEFNHHAEMLSEEHFDKTDAILTEIEPDREASKSLNQPINTAPSASSNSEIEGDYQRLNWSIGFGIGYSAHAASYFVDDGVRIKEFSGFRAIVLDTKVDWIFYERIAILGTWKYAPRNSIISPYRSNYLGGGLAYYFGYSQQFSIHGGLGKYQAKVGRNEVFGNGLLINYGAVVKLTDNFGFELNALSGKIKFDTASANILDSTEFNFTAGVAILF